MREDLAAIQRVGEVEPGDRTMVARRGRASYIGERALGAPDPASTGVALLFWSPARVAEPDTDLGSVTDVGSTTT